MYFYEFIFVTLVFHAFEAKLSSIDAGVDKASTDFEGIAFFITFNNTSTDDYYVKVIPGDCRLTEDTGGNLSDNACKTVVPKGQTKTIKFKATTRKSAAVTTDQCWINVHLKPYNFKNIREIVKIIFHISLLEGNNKTEIITLNCNNNNKDTINSSQFAECDKTHIIEDINYYKSAIKNCVTDTYCTTPYYYPTLIDTNIKNSKLVSNLLTAHAMVKRDIGEKDKASAPLSRDRASDHEKDVVSCETILVNTTEPFDLIDTKYVYPQTTEKHIKIRHKKLIHPKNLTLDQSVYKYFKQYKWITALLATITIIQCILIFTICMRRKCQSFGEKRVISHFFRTYQQDSVTTPLISTSAIDIYNSRNQFISESSTNIANLKCYKACGKDKSENTKISISDDILSKFINRREWKNQYKHCDENESIKDENQNNQIVQVHSKHKIVDKNLSKVNNDSAVASGEVVDNEGNNKKRDLKSSDNEGKYHSFSCYNTQVDSESTVEMNDPVTNESKSSEKAAQTCFSKDSIDAILSDRNIYLADQNLSKYTLSTDSGKNKSTELLHKASKNIVKYFNTLLHKRSRQSSQSEPGKDKDLKLLHMSEASLYSSNDSE